MTNLKRSIEFMLAGSEVKRYHTVTTLQNETVGHHSHGVAMLCIMLCPKPSVQLLKAALYHDLAEHVTGDIPSPAKRLYKIGEQVSDIEGALLGAVDLESGTLTEYEFRVLKLADIAQGAFFCLREMELGNRRMAEVLERYLSYYRLRMNDTALENELLNILLMKYQGIKNGN